MVELTPGEPQSARDYDDRVTTAVKSALVEIGQILGSFRGKFVVIGGAVPWLLLQPEDMQHVGTIDIDLALDAEALGDGEYVNLVDALRDRGYHKRTKLRRFQLVRDVPASDGGEAIEVIIDFLMPRDAVIEKNDPPLIENFAVQRADGADLALEFQKNVAVEANMPTGGRNRVEIAVCSIPALLAMKGHAINNRFKQKDAYDIYYCVRNYPDGPEALADQCRPLLEEPTAARGYGYIAEKFETIEHFGPISVREFVKDTRVLAGRTADQWQQDAFGQVDTWLRALGLRGSPGPD